MKKVKRFSKVVLIWTIVLIMLASISSEVLAAGTRSLIAAKRNGKWTYNEGSRVFFQDNSNEKKKSEDTKKAQKLYAYIRKGETAYFGSSTIGTKLNNGYEIKVKSPDGKTRNFNITKDRGVIDSKEKELNGPNYDGNTKGYTPLSIQVDGKKYPEGTYEFTFYSKTGINNKNFTSNLLKEMDDIYNDKSSQISSLDITVVEKIRDFYEEKTGRVWADYLSLTTGNNKSEDMTSKIYVVTNDGYCYKVNYSGISESGFFIFANNRGLIDTSNNTQLYQSVYAKNDNCTKPYYTKDGKEIEVQYHKPGAEDTDYDKTCKIFFETPSDDLPHYIKADPYEPEAIKDIKFVGTNSKDNEGRVGQGGNFIFTVTNASSYELKLDFSELKSAKKDEKGNYILDKNGKKVYERVQAVDRLSRKLYKDSLGNEVSLYDSEYSKNPNEYTPIYIDGTVYIRNACVAGENKAFWDGKDGNGHYVPKGNYGGKDSSLRISITPKSGEYHFIMLDTEENKKGIQVEMISKVNSYSRKNIKIPEKERNTIYYNNNNPDLLSGSNKKIKSSKEEAIKYLKDKSITGENTKEEPGMKFDGSLGNESIIDMWTYIKRQSDNKKSETKVKAFSLSGEEIKEDNENKITIKGSNKTNNKKKAKSNSVKITLKKQVGNGVPVKVDEKIVKVNKSGKYNYEFKSLQKYENNLKVNYSIEEANVKVDQTALKDENVQNTSTEDTKVVGYGYKVEAEDENKISINGGITWNDKNNEDKIRPESITIILNKTLEDGTVEEVEKKVISANEKDEWKYTFNNLARYDREKEIKYSIDEEEITGYTKVIKDYNIENIHNVSDPTKTEISGTIIWDDDNNKDEIRPESITVILNKEVDGKISEVTRKTVKEDSNGEWLYKFDDLDKFEGIHEIVYSIDEVEIDGYEKTILGYDIINKKSDKAVEPIVDTPKGTISGKVFYDNDPQEGIMDISEGDYGLEDVKVNLYRKMYDPSVKKYKYENIDSEKTDSLGNYRFANLDYTLDRETKEGVVTTPEVYYEVRVDKPYDDAELTTESDKFTNIKLAYDEQDEEALDIVNSPVGYAATTRKSVKITKTWSVGSSWLHWPVHIDLGAYYISEDGKYVEVPEYDVKKIYLSLLGGWSKSQNLPAEDSQGHKLVYYVKQEYIYRWFRDIEAETYGYEYKVSPQMNTIDPNATSEQLHIENIAKQAEIIKILDEPAEENTTFHFTVQDSSSSAHSDYNITIPKGETKGNVSVDVTDGRTYIVKEPKESIPKGFELDTERSYLRISGTTQESTSSGSEFALRFKFEKQETYIMTFYNNYKKSDIIITNNVTGNKSDTTKEFEYEFNINSEQEHPAVKTDAEGNTTELVLGSVSNFKLKDNEKIVVNMKLGTQYGITQTKTNYNTTINSENKLSYKGTVGEESRNIEFINTLDNNPLVGIDTNYNQLNVLAIMVLIIATYYFVVSRNRSGVRNTSLARYAEIMTENESKKLLNKGKTFEDSQRRYSNKICFGSLLKSTGKHHIRGGKHFEK